MNSTIPHRYSERSFRRYEPYIEQAVNCYPSLLKCEFHESLNINTFEARLRDAIHSLLEYGWTTNIDLTLLRQYQRQSFHVSRRGKEVFLGPSLAPLLPDLTPIAKPSPRLVSAKEFEALCIVLHSRLISGPITITSPHSEIAPFLQACNTLYDVSINQDSDDVFTLA